MTSAAVFLGLGECMVELAPTGVGSYQHGFAGDVFNTLWYAARALGPDWQVRFQTALGDDPLSDELAAFAASSGIDCSAVPRVSGRVPGLYMIRLSPDGERSFLYWREHSAARALMGQPESVRTQIMQAALVYVSGITLAILPPDDAEVLVMLMAEASAGGRVVAFDPNLRPRLWDSPARMRDLVSRAAAASTIVLPGFDDEAAAFGDAHPHDTASRYTRGFCDHVVVKNGVAPVTALVGGLLSVHETPGPVQTPVDTTAAGDSFNAAYLAAWFQGATVTAAVAAGQARAARTVMGAGALVP